MGKGMGEGQQEKLDGAYNVRNINKILFQGGIQIKASQSLKK
ncbi:hypothetical protein [Escherichia coli]|nr:hypothetical protein [Escherichia coli]